MDFTEKGPAINLHKNNRYFHKMLNFYIILRVSTSRVIIGVFGTW
jgi:hypothetical protein